MKASNPMKNILRAAGAPSLLVLALALSGCGDDDSPSTTDAGTTPVDSGGGGTDSGATMSTRGAVSGTVTYEGSGGAGRLTIGVWPSTPPAGPPTEFFAADDPTFPLEYELSGLSAGTYYLGVVYDIGSNNPTIPGAEDPSLFPTDPIEVEGGDTHTRDVTLVDPTP